jgi:hypothetical protein
MPYDRDKFFSVVRPTLFNGSLKQSQVDGMNSLLAVWEQYFEKPNPRDGTNWLAYCLATVLHETASAMIPVKENNGKPYGNPPGKYWTATGPYNNVYYGRGHVQLTWDTNYQKAQAQLLKDYNLTVPLYQYPDQMLQDVPSALVLYDGMSVGWFTGVGLPKYFNSTTEDPINARKIVNGTDKASTIASYYTKFKPALVKVTDPAPTPPPTPTPEPTPPVATTGTINIVASGAVIVTVNGETVYDGTAQS